MITVVNENDPTYELYKNDLFIDEECFSMVCTYRETNDDNEKSIFIVTTIPRDLNNKNITLSKDMAKEKCAYYFGDIINTITFSLKSYMKVYVDARGAFTFILSDDDNNSNKILKYNLYVNEKDDEKELIWWIQHHTKWEIILYN